MPIFDLFSKRQKKLRGEMPDVYVYDDLPKTLKVQIIHIWMDALGKGNDWHYSNVRKAYEFIVDLLCRENGVFLLPGYDDFGDRQFINELTQYFLQEENIDKAIDVIETTFRGIDYFTRDEDYLSRRNASEIADAAIEELNGRFKEHGVGYQYTNGEIIRIDSELIHSEVVKPALRLLNQRQYVGAQEEFLKAHEHYRLGNTKEALNECLKAFESVMKSICDKRGWTYSAKATAKDLIDTCLQNGLIPSFWQAHFSSLRSLLESSVPTGRNKLGGHGQGTNSVTVPNYLVAFMLHMTAAAIVFLAEAESILP